MQLEDRSTGRNRMMVVALAVGAVFGGSHAVQAASSEWKQLASGNAGGSWNDANNWQSPGIAADSNATADFSKLDLSADSTVTLDAPRIIGNVIFGNVDTSSAGSWILTAGTGTPTPTLTLSGTTPTITVNALGSNKSARINAALAGSDGLTKDGAGRLILAGSNTYSGTTNITAGNLTIGAGSTTGTVLGDIVIGSNATLQIDRNNAYTPAGNISGDGALNKTNGAGSLTLNGNNSYGGGTTISDGAVLMGTGTNNGIGAGTITLKAGRLGSADDNARTIANTVVLDGATFTLGASTGATTGRGDLVFSATASRALGGNRTLNVHNATSVTFRNPFSGSNHGINKGGTGTIILEGASTYSGATNVNVGTLLVNNISGTGTGTGAVNIAEGAILGGTGSIQGNVTFAADGADADALGAIFRPTSATDGLAIVGSLTLGDGSVLDLGNLSSLNPNSTYTSLTYGGTQLTGGFTVVSPLATHDVSYIGDHAVQLVPVPEPTTLGVLSMIGLAMIPRRRRH